MTAWRETPTEHADENRRMFDARQQTRSRDGFRLCEQIKVRLSPEMKRAIEQTAAHDRRTVSSVVRSAMRDYFTRQAKSKGTSRSGVEDV